MYTLAALSADSFCKEELLIILVSEEDMWLCFSLTSEKDLLLVGLLLLLLLLLLLVLVSFSSMTISSLLMSFSTLTLLTTVLSGFSVSWVLLVMLEKDTADLSCEIEEWEGGSGGGGEEGRGGGGELGREQDRPVGVDGPLGFVSGGGVGEGLEFLVIGMAVEFALCVSDKIGLEKEGDEPL